MNTRTIKDIPSENRPDERCIRLGASALTDAELLAVIIRCGVKGIPSTELSQRILDLSGEDGIIGILRLSINDLMEVNGIGIVKAVQIKCIAELSRRIAKNTMRSKLSFSNPASIAEYYMEDLRHKDCEELIMLSLNTKNMLISNTTLTKGTVNASLISTREIFLEALKNKAVYIVLLHNHPSGDPSPSKEDIHNTRRIKDAGNLIGISLIDHIIIGDNKYISLKERGFL